MQLTDRFKDVYRSALVHFPALNETYRAQEGTGYRKMIKAATNRIFEVVMGR